MFTPRLTDTGNESPLPRHLGPQNDWGSESCGPGIPGMVEWTPRLRNPGREVSNVPLEDDHGRPVTGIRVSLTGCYNFGYVHRHDEGIGDTRGSIEARDQEMNTTTERADRETGDPGVGDRNGILVGGETPVLLPAGLETAAEQFEVRTRTIGFECASGDWLEAEWTGVPLDPVLEAASLPPATTHVLAEAADGYRVCVAVWDLAGAMVAYDANDRPASDFPRFVSPAVDGPRAVKNLASVRSVELAPHEDPEDYENLQLAEK